MNKKIIIHIGMHKTGTTSVQHFLANNRSILEEAGISYPIEAKGKNKTAHHTLARSAARLTEGDMRNKKKKGLYAEMEANEQWRNLKKHIEKTDFQKYVISSEGFSRASRPAVIREYLGTGYDYTILVYLRRQDRYAESYYQQLVKDFNTRVTASFQQWLKSAIEKQLLDYSLLLERWENSFGENSIIVKIFDFEVEKGLVEKFIEEIAGSGVFEQLEKPKTTELQEQKESLDIRCVDVLRIFNAKLKARKAHTNVAKKIRRISQLLREEGNYQKHFFSDSERAKFMVRFEEKNRKLFKKYVKCNIENFPVVDLSLTHGDVKRSIKPVLAKFVDVDLVNKLEMN